MDSDVEDALPHFLKHNLIPSSKDFLISSIISCTNLEGLFNVVTKYSAQLKGPHICQTVLTLYDFQKLYSAHRFGGYILLDWSDTEIRLSKAMQEYLEERNKHPSFKTLLDLIQKSYENMETEHLAYTILFLTKLGLPIVRDPLQEKLKTEIESRIKEGDTSWTSLSLYAVALQSWRGLATLPSLIAVFNEALKRVDTTKTIEEFHQVSIIFRACNSLFTKEVMDIYSDLVNRFLSNGDLMTASPNTIIKALGSLTALPWSENKVVLIRQLLYLLAGKEEVLKLNQALYLYKVTQQILEPQSLITGLSQQFAKSFKYFYDSHSRAPPQLVSYYISQAVNSKQPNLRKYLQDYICQPQKDITQSFYSLIPLLKFCSHDTARSYWHSFLETIENEADAIESLVTLCEKYVSNLVSPNHTFRCSKFERMVLDIVNKEILNGLPSVQPRNFLYLSSFNLLCGARRKDARIPQYIYLKLLNGIDQLSPEEHHFLSKVLRFMVEKNQSALTSEFLDQYKMLCTRLNQASVDWLLDHPSCQLSDLNFIVRSFISRLGSRDDILFSLMIERYKTVTPSILNSRLLRNTIYNIMALSVVIPETMDALVEYACSNKEHVSGDTIGKLLHACYVFAFTPKQINELLDLAEMAILRDFNSLNGLTALQSSISLLFFNRLHPSLIESIFSVDFLEKMDEEIKLCYSKDKYPYRLRYHLMDLNRAVCLDKPEADVPWFHEKYCQQINSSLSKRQSPLHKEVHDSLVAICGSKDFVQEMAQTHYGYIVDFLVHLDEFGKLINKRDAATTERSKKVAFLINSSEIPFGRNKLSPGALEMKCRHLEMMEFKVVLIKANDWNSMFFSEESERIKFLRKSLTID